MRYNKQFLKQQDSKRLPSLYALALSCLTTFFYQTIPLEGLSITEAWMRITAILSGNKYFNSQISMNAFLLC